MHHGHTDDRVTKDLNRKWIRVTLSNERQEQKCVDFRHYKRNLNKFATELKYHSAVMATC